MDSASLPHQLTDLYGRRFEYLRLSITDVCNFKCQYCLPDGYDYSTKKTFLTLTEIDTIASAFALIGTKKIRITGGEPSLRRDLPDVIKTVARIDNIQEVAITTNGYKLNSQIHTWVEAGLTHLNVSLDSLDPKQFELITGDGRFQNIMQGIQFAIDLGITVKVNAVLLKSFTYSQLERFLIWVKDKPISMRFIELMQTGDNLQFFEKEHVSGQSIKQMLLDKGWKLNQKNKLAGPAQVFRHTKYTGSVGLIMPYSKDFCSDCNRLRVSALGDLHLCLFSENGISLRDSLAYKTPMLVAAKIVECLGDKKQTHYLLDGQTGATTHLAMLGG